MGIEINKLSLVNGKEYRRLSIDSEPAPLEMEEVAYGDSASSDQISTSTGELAGVYFGIFNLYVTLPQFLGTFISMVVFSTLEPGKSPELAMEAEPHEVHRTDGPNAIAVILFIGALSAVGAANAARKLKYL
jgi:solute carrier family 45 protein 1/2/4